MVYKVKKGGVRSGSTLRGLRTVYGRRYARHACIVGRTSLPCSEVQRLLEESTDDASVSEALQTTDVVLSLNKKQRWTLPATVNHMIQSGRFSNNDTTVTLLEKHKLRRKANCINISSNKKGMEIPSNQQKGVEAHEDSHQERKYFSFDFSTTNLGESKKQWKRRRNEAFLKLRREARATKLTIEDFLPPYARGWCMAQWKRKKDQRRAELKKEGKWGLKNRLAQSQKSQTVVTVSSDSRYSKPTEDLSSDQPEYRLEVFYPSPQSSALAFNRKYTQFDDVKPSNPDEEEKEDGAKVISHKKVRCKKHTRPMMIKEIATLNSDIADSQSDVEQMWRQVYDEDYSDSDYSQIKEEQQQKDSIEIVNKMQPISLDTGGADLKDEGSGNNKDVETGTLACLIDKAERAKEQIQDLSYKRRQRTKSGRHNGIAKCGLEPLLENQLDVEGVNKPHIVRITKESSHKSLTISKTATSVDINAQVWTKDPPISFGNVRLLRKSTTPEMLAEVYDKRYIMTQCIPRRFCINISEDVMQMFTQNPEDVSKIDYSSFLVFIHAGAHDENMDQYKVVLNSSTCPTRTPISLQATDTVEEVVKAVLSTLRGLIKAGEFNIASSNPDQDKENPVPFHDMLMSKLGMKCNSFYTRDALVRASESGSLNRKIICEEKDDDTINHVRCDKETCEICFETFTNTLTDPTPSMRLKSCCHMFCGECWRAHLRTRFHNGSVRMLCPGYKCDAQLNTGTLLALLDVTEVAQIMSRHVEMDLEISPWAKWCPSSACGRMVLISVCSKNLDDRDSESGSESSNLEKVKFKNGQHDCSHNAKTNISFIQPSIKPIVAVMGSKEPSKNTTCVPLHSSFNTDKATRAVNKSNDPSQNQSKQSDREQTQTANTTLLKIIHSKQTLHSSNIQPEENSTVKTTKTEVEQKFESKGISNSEYVNKGSIVDPDVMLSDLFRTLNLQKEPTHNTTCSLPKNKDTESKTLDVFKTHGLAVPCFCGANFCFNCLKHPHWPASCQQAQHYLENLSKIKPLYKEEETNPVDLDNNTQSLTDTSLDTLGDNFEVVGRLCPRCRRFLEWKDGCEVMTCRCSHQFCWKCLQPATDHAHRDGCNPNPVIVEEYTRRIKYMHLTMGIVSSRDAAESAGGAAVKTSSRTHSHGVSMYQRALNQRTVVVVPQQKGKSIQDLCARICKLASQDAGFKREVLLQCGVPTSEIPQDSSLYLDSFPVAHRLTKYLHACYEAKISAHQIAEFTYVLLQHCSTSPDKRRAHHLVSELVSYCSFVNNVLHTGRGGEAGGPTAHAREDFRRLVDTQSWMRRALVNLLVVVNRLRS